MGIEGKTQQQRELDSVINNHVVAASAPTTIQEESTASNSWIPWLKVEGGENGATVPTTTRPKIRTAICLTQKSQLYDLEEWIDYHFVLGFDSIYIYDNSDEFELERFFQIKSQNLSSNKSLYVRHHPGPKQQLQMYEKCWREQKLSAKEVEDLGGNNGEHHQHTKYMSPYRHDWLAFWDSDEFLVLKKHNTIQEFLADYNDDQSIDGIAMNRISIYFFNDGNGNGNQDNITNNATTTTTPTIQRYYEPLPVTRKFQYRLQEPDHFVKTIARVSQIKQPKIHFPKYRRGDYTRHVDPTNRESLGTRPEYNMRRPEDVAAIYHYQTKSLEEFQSKCNRGDVMTGPGHALACQPSEKIVTYFQNSTNQHGGLVYDDSAWKFLSKAIPGVYGRTQ